jgi:DNA repair exonuclease SbcCD ATPase subunit
MSLKIKDLRLENFGKYSQVDVNFDPNVTYLVGPNGSSKTTIGLTAIWFILQGISEKSAAGTTPIIGERYRFIKNDFTSAKGILTLEDLSNNDVITITRKITKDRQEVKIESEKQGTLNQKWLDDLFNVFMISPKRFSQMSPKEQAIALGLDVSVFNHRIKELKAEYTEINRDIRNIGETPQEPHIITEVDIDSIKVRMKNVAEENNKVQIHNQQFHDLKAKNKNLADQYDRLKAEEAELFRQLKLKADEIAQTKEDMSDCYYKIQEFVPLVEVSVDEVSLELDEAMLQKDDMEAKKRENEKLARKQKLEIDLINNKNEQAKVDAWRIEYLQSQNLKIKGLDINEEGELTYNDRYIREPFYSTGELIRIVINLNARIDKNPDSLKYVFIQDWDLLDAENQIKIQESLLKLGYQIVIEHVGTEAVVDKNCIILGENTKENG